MLRYFPEIYPDELMFSVLARYKHHAGLLSWRSFWMSLFPKQVNRMSVELPNKLDLLSSRFSPARRLSSDGLVETTTLYPYFCAYLDERRREDVRQAMRDPRGMPQARLNLGRQEIARPKHFRFCRECRDGSIASEGEFWWVRSHQLPGTLFCARHGTPLLASNVVASGNFRSGLQPALEENCPSDGAELCAGASPRARRHLRALAVSSAALLQARPEPWAKPACASLYRRRLHQAGLFRTHDRVNKPALNDAFTSMLGETLAFVGVAAPATDRSWLLRLTYGHDIKGSPPLHHLLMDLFLDELESSPVGVPRASGELKLAPSPGVLTRPTKSPTDWALLDADTAVAVARSADEIRCLEPPVQVCAAEIARRHSSESWLVNRRSRMPKTTAALAAVGESTEHFQHRRVAWVIRRLAKSGLSLTVSRICREAHLHYSVKHVAEQELQRFLRASQGPV